MNPHDDYPRPDFDRSHRWLSLNGAWDFAPDPDDHGREERWERPGGARWPDRIVVPFPWEAPASGVSRHWLPVAWYRRVVERPSGWAGERTILHVGAAHYACQVWLNGRWIGEHSGGYLPFSFDITDSLHDGRGELILRVEAPLDKRSIPHGKQRSRPADDYDDCSFTPSSGIWQSVWLEGRPSTYIERLDLRPTDDLTGIHARVQVAGPCAREAAVTLTVDGLPRTLALHDGVAVAVIPLDHPILWSPRTPHLYTVTVRLRSADGDDQVSSYTGLRRIEVWGDRLVLNGERIYIRGVLDQGYWPEGGYTAPDDAALRRDVELILAAGYNLSRKHIKFEDPRWLYWADRLGLLVWAEPPCIGRYSPEAVARFEAQLAPWVARDGNHPGIILWGLYNEEWGLDWRVGEDQERQDAVRRAYDLLAALDHSRPIIDNSGWWHVKTDVLDWHYYDNDVRRWNEVTTTLAGDAETWFGHQLGVDHWYETQLSVAGADHAGLPLLNGEYGAGQRSASGAGTCAGRRKNSVGTTALAGTSIPNSATLNTSCAAFMPMTAATRTWGATRRRSTPTPSSSSASSPTDQGATSSPPMATSPSMCEYPIRGRTLSRGRCSGHGMGHRRRQRARLSRSTPMTSRDHTRCAAASTACRVAASLFGSTTLLVGVEPPASLMSPPCARKRKGVNRTRSARGTRLPSRSGASPRW